MSFWGEQAAKSSNADRKYPVLLFIEPNLMCKYDNVQMLYKRSSQ
jgi:hypothetical protein